MDQLYWALPPAAPPMPPGRWSYSSLARWRECPRRWWLERAEYPNVPGPRYPTPVGASAVEGQLVHRTIQEWQRAARRPGGPAAFSPRAFVTRELKALLGELKGNPRVDLGKVAAAVSVDVCLAKFFALTERLPSDSPIVAGGTQPVGLTSRPPGSAEEHWLVTDRPPLKGQLDRIRGGCICDFKTGEPGPGHADQLRFYATLWWVRFGTPPARLELRYPSGVLQIPVPAPGELEAWAEELALEIDRAEAELAAGHAEARPDPEWCRYCPVRHLCDGYWSSVSTRPLREPDGRPPDEVQTASVCDVRITQLPDGWKPGHPCAGLCQADVLGEVSVKLASVLCPSPLTNLPTEARILRARVTNDGAGGLVVTNTIGTEVFWVRSEETFV